MGGNNYPPIRKQTLEQNLLKVSNKGIMIKGSTEKENVTAVSVQASNARENDHFKQMLIYLKGDTDETMGQTRDPVN